MTLSEQARRGIKRPARPSQLDFKRIEKLRDEQRKRAFKSQWNGLVALSDAERKERFTDPDDEQG